MAYKILVVDDDLAILRLIKKVLEYEKYEVVIRNNIEEIDLCDFTEFDLILLYSIVFKKQPCPLSADS